MSDEGSEGASQAERTPLQQLLVLQDQDLHADQLRFRLGRLPEREALEAIEAEQATLAKRGGELSGERGGHLERQSELEKEIAETTSRIGRIEARMREGAASSFRDQEAMAAEIASLGHRRSELEDLELEVMEILEPIEQEVADLAASAEILSARRAEAVAALAVAEAAIRTELDVLAEARAELTAPLPAPLLAEYERLRARLDGIGVARLVNGTCSGCHLHLPATEIDAIHRAPPGSAVHCEQCGRILVP
ncbi:MAG: Zn-ribbon protein [Acidimicrobiaceae bacterium]|nr:Zn-ribbon protein [Acidimicrobiaceae bacterium]